LKFAFLLAQALFDEIHSSDDNPAGILTPVFRSSASTRYVSHLKAHPRVARLFGQS
jgi:hypothetical protein